VAAHVLADSVQILGRIFDDSGVAVSPLLYITSTGRNERPSVAWVRAAHAYAIVWEDGHRIRGVLHDEITGVAVTPLKTISQAPINGGDQRADIVAVYGLGTVAVWDRTDPGQNEPSRIVARAQEWSGPFAPIGLEVEIESIPGGSGYLRAPKLTQSGEPDPATPQSTWTHRIVWERFW
tara:strand:- start:449 stop:985 length:537 start_codon:yes stop_codon:yes gene_type:complete